MKEHEGAGHREMPKPDNRGVNNPQHLTAAYQEVGSMLRLGRPS